MWLVDEVMNGDRGTVMRCPKCRSAGTQFEPGSRDNDWTTRARCSDCGYEEVDRKIGGTAHCRCPRCSSDEVAIEAMSAQSGNTDWEIFTCGKCGFDSGSVDDQLLESACEWYDPSKYGWLREIAKARDEAARRAAKGGSGKS